MSFSDLRSRIQIRYRRDAARLFFKKPFAIDSETPTISFTFDDFPRSALSNGGAILKGFGLRGTYYTALGLMGTEIATGNMFVPEDLAQLLEEGHELASHTFSHCHAWETEPAVFENSIMDNEEALHKLCPGASFRTFSYPIGAPRPEIKHRTGRHFVCSRGGGQAFNAGTADLNFLRAYFLDKDRSDPKQVKKLIEENAKARGWLIFATHDISDTPTRFGCKRDVFKEIVQYAVSSGARILPVINAWEALLSSSPRRHNK